MREDPQKIVVPLIGLDASGSPRKFLGTGSFCGERPYLVTADHVIHNWTGPIGITVPSDNITPHRTIILGQLPEADVAVLEVPDYRPPFALPIGDPGNIALDAQIVSLEYGTTRSLGNEIHFSPATRLGNVTRTMNMKKEYGLAGDTILELSFPALRGASGSPVLCPGRNYELWGIVIANVSYHLLPAQIENVLTEDSKMEEEIKFMLPQALAVNVKHLRSLIESLPEK